MGFNGGCPLWRSYSTRRQIFLPMPLNTTMRRSHCSENNGWISSWEPTKIPTNERRPLFSIVFLKYLYLLFYLTKILLALCNGIHTPSNKILPSQTNLIAWRLLARLWRLLRVSIPISLKNDHNVIHYSHKKWYLLWGIISICSSLSAFGGYLQLHDYSKT